LTARRAEPRDADDAAAVLRRSITELCVADHQNDPVTLELWLRNKTAEQFLVWLDRDENHVVVVDSSAGIAGVGLLHRSGEIRLCYVCPGWERLGIGTAVLRALEIQAEIWGLTRLTLESTATARSFYERHGYVPVGGCRPGLGVSCCHPYEKAMA
jgi:GNAT superfamily N-acetyltransferase